MSDGTTNSPEVNLASQGETLQSKGIVLYKSSRFEVFIPQKPNIPLNEGLHVQVSSKHDASDSPKEVLGRYLLAEGVAKVLAESGQTREAWANTRIEEGQRVSVYGRVPGEERSWRKPVDTFGRNVSDIGKLEPNYDTQKFVELSTRYLPKWEELVSQTSLFKDGVNGKDIEPSTRTEIPVWENDKFTLVVVSNPHLKGVHLVVHPKESFKRQWQTSHIQLTLEATAIAMGVQKLLAQGKGEIHNSGNWAPDLKTTDEGGKFNLQNFADKRKAEKRSHRPDIAEPQKQINTGMHAHVYIPETENVVSLPPLSKTEATERMKQREKEGLPTDEYQKIISQWDAIPSVTQNQLQEVKSKLGEGKLTSWLEGNCQGFL